MKPSFNICVSAGENSGDRHAAGLLSATQEAGAEISIFGAGGNCLRQIGAEILVPMENIAVVGITEVISHLPDIWKGLQSMKESISARRPDALLLVDFPDFNFRLAKHALGLKIPVIYYITPQVWAWRPGRVKFMSRALDKALVIFPFEEPFLRDRGVDAVFVGHPLVGAVTSSSAREEFCSVHRLDPEIPIVALLPGSRGSEIKRILPTLEAAARVLLERGHRIRAVVPWAQSLKENPPDASPGAPVQFIAGDYNNILAHASAAAVASGTATLETALAGVPQIAVYRLAPISYLLGRAMVSVEHFSLPNVVLGRNAVPELLQGAFTPEKVADALAVLLSDPDRSKAEAVAIAEELGDRLGSGGAYDRAAKELIETMCKKIKTPS